MKEYLGSQYAVLSCRNKRNVPEDLRRRYSDTSEYSLSYLVYYAYSLGDKKPFMKL